MEQPCVLEHHTKHLPKFAPVEISDIMPIDLNRPTVHIIETHQKFNHSCLACASRSYDCDLLSFFHCCREIIDNDLIRVIPEMHMFKFYISPKPFYGYRIRNRLVLFLFVKELKHSLGRRRGKLQHVRHLSHLLDGLGEIPYILDKGLDISNLYDIANRKEASKDRHADISQISDKLHHRHHHT